MPRFNITMPQELWDRVGEVAPEGNRSWFIRRALEAALGSPYVDDADRIARQHGWTPKTGVGSFGRQLAEGVAPQLLESTEGPSTAVLKSQAKRCPNGCVEGITSPAVSKCRVCSAGLVG